MNITHREYIHESYRTETISVVSQSEKNAVAAADSFLHVCSAVQFSIKKKKSIRIVLQRI
jgi:hypothetical protein